MQTVAFFAVLSAAGYLLLLGVGAFVQPARTAAFLGGFAQTLPAHLLELAVRIGIGTALVARASSMHFGAAFTVFGWVLVASSIALAVIPWRLHQRFARWSVPQATRRMPLLGIGSSVAGLVLLAALVLPRAAS